MELVCLELKENPIIRQEVEKLSSSKVLLRARIPLCRAKFKSKGAGDQIAFGRLSRIHASEKTMDLFFKTFTYTFIWTSQ